MDHARRKHDSGSNLLYAAESEAFSSASEGYGQQHTKQGAHEYDSDSHYAEMVLGILWHEHVRS